MNTNHLLTCLAAVCIAFPAAALADPAAAEDDCYKMAVYYTQRGFAMTPTNYTGMGGAGHTVKYTIPVSKGLDYTFLVGRDKYALDLDIYVYDEVGSLILDDRRPDARAGVKFRSSYNGTVFVYVHLARASGMAAYSVLVGRRGVEKGAPSVSVPDANPAAPSSEAAASK